MINPVAKLKLSLDQSGHGSISIDGMDIGHCVTAISFKAGGDGLSEIKLTITADVDAEITAKLDKIALAKDDQDRTVRLADGRVLKVRHRAPA